MAGIKRINLWSSPRNISTAMMYSFAQRADTTVVDEPLYAFYLSKTGADHPGRVAVLKYLEADGQRVIDDVLMAKYPTPVVVFKQMTHHLLDIDTGFMDKMMHVLLIRDPALIIASYAKVRQQPNFEELGFRQQLALANRLRDKGKLTAVVDAGVLLKNPGRVLRLLCRKLKIDFDENMLHWPAGPRPEDGVWAKYWYANVHRSTGFAAPGKVHTTLTGKLSELDKNARPYYESLFEMSIQ